MVATRSIRALTGVGNAAAFTAAAQAAINAAGAAASAGHRQIVLLKAGTYYVNPQTLPSKGGRVGLYVTVDNVTLRGEGADTTRLVANGTIPEYGTVVLFGHRTGFSDADFRVVPVTGNAWMWTNTVPVADASRFAVGDVITIDMLDGPAKAVGAIQFNGNYLWFYDAQYFKRQPTFSWGGPSTGAAGVNVSDLGSANSAAVNAVPRWRSMMQTNEIVGISGNTLIVKDRLVQDFFDWRQPQVWRVVPKDNRSVFLGNRWSGIENIGVAGGTTSGVSRAGPSPSATWPTPGRRTWRRTERATTPPHPGKDGYNIGLGRCYRCEFRDSYVHDSRDENPGGQAYGIVLGTGTSASLVENNISINNNKPVASISSGGGNVIAYNYVDNAVLWNSPGWQESAIDDSHGAFTHNDLIEGNWTPEHRLGHHPRQLGLAHPLPELRHRPELGGKHHRQHPRGRCRRMDPRQRLRRKRAPGRQRVRDQPLVAQRHAHLPLGNNFWRGGGWDNGYAAAHIYRDGNWDSVNGRTIWANGARTLPPSLYRTSKPAFFGSNPWPWVDPLTGTVSTLPAKARYDAGRPNVVP